MSTHLLIQACGWKITVIWLCVCVCVLPCTCNFKVSHFCYSRKRSVETCCSENPGLQVLYFMLPLLTRYKCLNHFNIPFLAFSILVQLHSVELIQFSL